jgi:hypothetical protein
LRILGKNKASVFLSILFMKKIKFPAKNRGHADFDWLKANYSFSFARYFDPDRLSFGALRVLNDDFIAPAKGFPKHSHKNMEIITIPLEGKLKHEDSTGNAGVIERGEVQVMSAGTGIYHSEKNPDPDQRLNLLQIWISPKEKEIEPRYDQKKFEVKKNEFQCLVSPISQSNNETLGIHQNAYLYNLTIETHKELKYQLNDKIHGVFLFMIEGEIELANQNLSSRDAMEISETPEFNIKANKESKLICIEVPLK